MMSKILLNHGVVIGFSEDLAFFFPRHPKGYSHCHDLGRRASVKDIIQAKGVPHTEVGELRFNRELVDFSFVPETGGQLDVKGIIPPFDVSVGCLLRNLPLDDLRFIADLNVMKLGRYLLFLGYDVMLARGMPDETIAKVARKEKRIVLTRDTRLLFRNKIDFARRLRSSCPMTQLAETLAFFGLHTDPEKFFSRCVRCNRALIPVDKQQVYHLLEPKTQKYFSRFLFCPQCRQVFWKGSHYDRILDRFRRYGVLNSR